MSLSKKDLLTGIHQIGEWIHELTKVGEECTMSNEEKQQVVDEGNEHILHYYKVLDELEMMVKPKVYDHEQVTFVIRAENLCDETLEDLVHEFTEFTGNYFHLSDAPESIIWLDEVFLEDRGMHGEMVKFHARGTKAFE